MTTKGDTISRVRDMIKAANQDAFVTDRMLYSVVLKYAKFFVARLDNANKLAQYRSLFEPLCVDLIEVDATDACCIDIVTCCKVMRTKDKLPPAFEGSRGPVFRTVSSADFSQIVQPTYPALFSRMINTTNFKYNKKKYYWLLDGYAYFPNLEWETVMFEGLWEDSVDLYKCCGNPCLSKQDEPTSVPDMLFMEIENQVRQEVLTLIQIPKEPQIEDNQSKFKD